jgi:hypothetical protein
MLKKYLFVLLICSLHIQAQAADSENEDLALAPAVESDTYDLTQDRIPIKYLVTSIPETSIAGLKMAFSKESLPYWGLILGTTALTYAYDENILDEVQRQGRQSGIGNGDGTSPLFQIGPWDVRFPTDKSSSLYFLGDGLMHLGIASSLLGYGYFSDNNRPYNTGIQVMHGMVVSTIFSQALKRSFGRESPNQKTEYRGAWEPFPSFQKYGNDTAKYDAMPSGHVMTATMTFTVLIENYPEYEYWLRPLEVTWVTLLGWEMVNNGVHWASDYPLGIGMGYVFGKAAAKLGKKQLKKSEDGTQDKYSWTVVPQYNRLGVMTTNLIVSF